MAGLTMAHQDTARRVDSLEATRTEQLAMLKLIRNVGMITAAIASVGTLIAFAIAVVKPA